LEKQPRRKQRRRFFPTTATNSLGIMMLIPTALAKFAASLLTVLDVQQADIPALPNSQ
jgi:hypothetical protein